MADNKPEVAVIMGSASDWETMKHACAMLDQFEVPYMKQVISAHRTPELMGEFATVYRQQRHHRRRGPRRHRAGRRRSHTACHRDDAPTRCPASIVQMPGGKTVEIESPSESWLKGISHKYLLHH